LARITDLNPKRNSLWKFVVPVSDRVADVWALLKDLHVITNEFSLFCYTPHEISRLSVPPLVKYLVLAIMINVEWESSVIQHGRNQGKLKSSTVHGWLVKMRGTLIGDERMRWRGIQEMRSASRHRERSSSAPPLRRSSGSRKRSGGSGVFSSLFGSTKRPSSRHGGKSRGGSRAPRRAQSMPVKRSDNRPASNSRRPSGQSRRSSAQSSRQSHTSKRRANTR